MRSLPADGLKVLNAWKPEQSRSEYVCSVPGGGKFPRAVLAGKGFAAIEFGGGKG